MTKYEFYIELCKSVLDENSSEEDVLACMVVLHIYCFQKKKCVAIDDAGDECKAGEVCVLMAITRNDASDVISEVMKSYGLNRSPAYWHHLYCSRTPFESFDDISDDWLGLTDKKVEKMKGTIVDDLWPED